MQDFLGKPLRSGQYVLIAHAPTGQMGMMGVGIVDFVEAPEEMPAAMETAHIIVAVVTQEEIFYPHQKFYPYLDGTVNSLSIVPPAVLPDALREGLWEAHRSSCGEREVPMRLVTSATGE